MSFRFADPLHTVNKFARPGIALWMLVAALWLGLLPGYSWANVLDPSRSATGNSADFVRIPGHVLPALAKATIVPSNPRSESESVDLTIVFKRHRQAQFERYLHDVYDPHSKAFRHFLTQRQIADRFGPSRQVYDAMLRYMRANGFALVAGSKNRLSLTVRSTRANAERTFEVSISDYNLGKRSFYATDRDPALPMRLAGHVQSVAGLSDLASPIRTDQSADAAGALAGASPDWQLTSTVCFPFTPVTGINFIGVLEASYLSITTRLEAAPLFAAACTGFLFASGVALGTCNAMAVSNPSIWQTSLQCAEFAAAGAGPAANDDHAKSSPKKSSPATSGFTNPQKIGLLEFDTFHPTDVQDWLEFIGGGATFGQLSEVPVNGGVASPGSNEPEVLLDVDTVMELAPLPGNTYVVYDAPSGTSFQTLFNQMIDDGDTVISNSWTQCENQTSQADAQGIDTILSNAAASGISVINGSGDSGSTCLDGAANTIGVPSDSPNATAVGGTTPIPGSGLTYGSETWWNGVANSPPTGQGGFGVSQFFTRPSYQNGLTSSAMRSVPDVVVDADPQQGLVICQADNGGCPSGPRYGGTSMAAPEWAAYIADLNAMLGSNLGNANLHLYPLSNTTAFHDAAALGSDFAHVGLGSPNFPLLRLALSNGTLGGVSATGSAVTGAGSNQDGTAPADGKTTAEVLTVLSDDSMFPVSGKSVSLSTNAGTAIITPSSVVTDSQGAAAFTVTDLNVEPVTITATDTTDGVIMTEKPVLTFVPPPAAGASINASPISVVNDGVTATMITVTLKDTNGNPSPGKLVNISQTGNSSISGPTPQVTDPSGNIQFTATDLVSESVTYTAVDVTDGNLPVPASTAVDFSGDPSAGCVFGTPPAAPGFIVTPYATGFAAENLGIFSNVNIGCAGLAGIAFDSSGNLYANDEVNGTIYKFAPGGGVAGPGTQLNSTALGEALTGLVFDSSGHLFATRQVTGGNFNTGEVLQIDPSDGSLIRTISSGLTCSDVLSIDPLSQDLFTDDNCTGSGSDNPSIFRISDPSGASPTTSVYATLTGTPNATLAFAPGGTIYAWADTGVPQITEVSGTNGPATPTVTPLGGVQLANLGLLAAGTGEGTSLIANPFVNNAVIGINNVDLTTSPPSVGTSFMQKFGANFMVFGPDGCIYTSQLNTVYRITDTSGGCSYATTLSSPTLVLSPTSVSPNPAQGTSQTFNAALHYATAPPGTQILFAVTGANPQFKQVVANGSGQASFSYVAAHPGVDTITASTTISSTPVTSNQAVVTWGAGSDTTFVSLNGSPKSALPGQMVNLVASLTDTSQSPATALSGQTIDFSAGGQNCNAPTNAQGIATCQVTASGGGLETLTASFAGATGLLASNDSSGFTVVVPATTPTATPATPTATPTATATPTPTLTATPTATPTPVPGKLKIRPKKLNFGNVEVGSDKVKSVKITNAGKIKKKRVPLPILIEMETGATNPFSITQTCDDDDLGPRGKGIPAGSCEVSVTFTPTAAQKYSGTLMIDTNLESGPDKSVKLEGVGKVPKVKK